MEINSRNRKMLMMSNEDNITPIGLASDGVETALEKEAVTPTDSVGSAPSVPSQEITGDGTGEVLPEAPKLPEGHLLISDMTREQLINCVQNLSQAHQQQKMMIDDFKKRARAIEKIWCDKQAIKKRFFDLRDNPKACEVKING